MQEKREELMARLLKAALAPSYLEVVDDSQKHMGHAGARPGGQTHFTVNITSQRFAGLNRVARHRLVYEAIGPQFAEGLHALAIIAKAEGE